MKRSASPKGILFGLALSAFALAVAPAVMPSGYIWVEHTTSESAAQGVDGAWLARLGFLVFGLSVVVLSTKRPRHWDGWAGGFHFAFGALMAMAAAVSIRPWMVGAEFDPTEDFLHSFAATAMGFAFAFGVTAVAARLYRLERRVRVLDLVAVIAP